MGVVLCRLGDGRFRPWRQNGHRHGWALENDDPAQHSRLAALGCDDADRFSLCHALSDRSPELEDLNPASRFLLRRRGVTLPEVASLL